MTHSQILINQMSFNLPTGKSLFSNLTLAFSQNKIGLVGRNGIGKSTLLKLIVGEIQSTSGSIATSGKLEYVPQLQSFPEDMTISAVLGYGEKLNALKRISQGDLNEKDFTILNDEWDIEEQMQKQLKMFSLEYLPNDRRVSSLSGGEITCLLLTKVFQSDADFLLLDEPTNHLDLSARQDLYHAIQAWQKGLIVISHDRSLLNLMEGIIELTTLGAVYYGGNYDDYEYQKEIENAAARQTLQHAKKSMHKTKKTIQESYEKHERKKSYGKKLRRTGSIDKLSANAKKGRSEKTQNKLVIKEERLLKEASSRLKEAQEKIEESLEINVNLPETQVPNGKVIVNIENLSFAYPNSNSIIHNFNLCLQGPERIALAGCNGSGKTTLIKLLMDSMESSIHQSSMRLIPQSGTIYLGTQRISYLDQNASLLNSEISILENFLLLNVDSTENHAHACLAQFLFRNIDALKLAKNLSGGEKLRALLACILMSKHPPQLLILDEPTNHLDLGSIKRIESALQNYQGAMVVISHDERFLRNIGIDRIIYAPFTN